MKNKSNARDINTSLAMYESMQEDDPFKTYEKTILGKVSITIIDPFSEEPRDLLLYGNPNDPSQRDTTRINVWTRKEDQFLQRVNKNHFDEGILRQVSEDEPKQEEVDNPNQISDDEIRETLNKPFLAIKAMLNSFTAEAPAYRTLTIAEDMEKSEKILKHIRARLSELEMEGILGANTEESDEDQEE